MSDGVPALWGIWFLFFFLPWFFFWRHAGSEPEESMQVGPRKKRERELDPDDYWDEGEIYGTISSNSGATIRHPKNADRAYSGSAERFHDGGW